MQCPLCSLNKIETDEQRAIQMCNDCASRLGVIEMPPALRRPLPCARCNGRKFTRVVPREHIFIEGTGTVGAPSLATSPPRKTPLLGWDRVDLETKIGYGLLEMYACWGCGHVEWYCRDVASIPIHPHLMTELIDLDATGPYR